MTITTPNGLVDLAGRLTDTRDRETYAALVSFIDSLPESDELFRIAQMLGLVSLVGQRIPEAAGELLTELRAQAKAAGEYQAEIDARLAALPSEIAAGVDPSAIAKVMSEAFRQQFVTSGLRDSALLMEAATKTVKAVSNDITENLKAATDTLSGETAKLVTAASRVQQQNERLVARERSQSRTIQWLLGFLIFVAGGICGISICAAGLRFGPV